MLHVSEVFQHPHLLLIQLLISHYIIRYQLFLLLSVLNL